MRIRDFLELSRFLISSNSSLDKQTAKFRKAFELRSLFIGVEAEALNAPAPQIRYMKMFAPTAGLDNLAGNLDEPSDRQMLYAEQMHCNRSCRGIGIYA